MLPGLRNNRSLQWGAGILTVVVGAALIVPLLTGVDPLQGSPRARLQMPSLAHPLGTDNFGRDLLARLLAGAITSMWLALQVTVLATIAGSVIGITAAFWPKVDAVTMRICDAFLAIPGVLLAVSLAASFGPTERNLIIALSIVFTPGVARIVRSRALAVRNDTFVQAAQVMGASPVHMMWKHIFPNTLSVLAVQAAYIFADTIISESALSFLGAGIPTPQPSWGNILYDGKSVITRAPHMVVFASTILVITVIGLNLFGDGLRDIFDPRSRRRRSLASKQQETV